MGVAYHCCGLKRSRVSYSKDVGSSRTDCKTSETIGWTICNSEKGCGTSGSTDATIGAVCGITPSW